MTIAGAGTWTISWPYPQVIFTDYYTIGIAKDGTNLKLYELVNTSNTWTATEIVTLGVTANIEYVEVTGFGQMYTIAASKIISEVLTVASWIRNPAGGVTAMETAAIPEFATCCNFNNQALISGVTSTDPNWADPGYSAVHWAGIGSFDFRIAEDKTAGNRPIMPWDKKGHGRVFKLLQLGKHVIAYGDGGIAALSPIQQPTTGYGLIPLSSAGIKSANHIAGDEHIHCFISSNNEICLITPGPSITILGYEEFVDKLNLSGDRIRISYVPSKKRFYISDGTYGYVLNEQGLYSINQLVTSAGDYRGNVLCGFFDDDGDYEARIKSDTLDFGIRGLKTISVVEVGTNYYHDSGSSKMYGRADYRYSYQSSRESFTSGKLIELNPNGIFTPYTQADEFRIMVKAEDYRNAVINLDYVKTRVKLSDKRAIRGLYKTS